MSWKTAASYCLYSRKLSAGQMWKAPAARWISPAVFSPKQDAPNKLWLLLRSQLHNTVLFRCVPIPQSVEICTTSNGSVCILPELPAMQSHNHASVPLQTVPNHTYSIPLFLHISVIIRFAAEFLFLLSYNIPCKASSDKMTFFPLPER